MFDFGASRSRLVCFTLRAVSR